MMDELITLPKALWAISVGGQCLLLTLLVARKAYRAYPTFTIYVVVTILQNTALYLIPDFLRASAYTTWRMTWIVQGIIIIVRAAALAEVCQHFLRRFRGIWLLARRILIGGGVAMLVASAFAARRQGNLAALYGDRNVELALATVIVILFLFARYYELPVQPESRRLAIGFFFYSCVNVINDSVLEYWGNAYLAAWNLLGTFAFLTALLLWTWAFFNYRRVTISEQMLLPDHVYRELSPEVNRRLRRLNERLSDFWAAEAPRP